MAEVLCAALWNLFGTSVSFTTKIIRQEIANTQTKVHSAPSTFKKVKIKRGKEKGRTDTFTPPTILSYVNYLVMCLHSLKAMFNTSSSFVPYSALVCSCDSLSKHSLFTYKVLLIGLSNGSTMCSV